MHYLVKRTTRRTAGRCGGATRATCSSQIKNYCVYYGRPMELRPDYLDRVVKSYFTAVTRPSDCGNVPAEPPTSRSPLPQAPTRSKHT